MEQLENFQQKAKQIHTSLQINVKGHGISHGAAVVFNVFSVMLLIYQLFVSISIHVDKRFQNNPSLKDPYRGLNVFFIIFYSVIAVGIIGFTIKNIIVKGKSNLWMSLLVFLIPILCLFQNELYLNTARLAIHSEVYASPATPSTYQGAEWSSDPTKGPMHISTHCTTSNWIQWSSFASLIFLFLQGLMFLYYKKGWFKTKGFLSS